MPDFPDLDSHDPLKRELEYFRFSEEVLGPEWVERWARERGKLEALREWRKLAGRPLSEPQAAQGKEGQSALD